MRSPLSCAEQPLGVEVLVAATQYPEQGSNLQPRAQDTTRDRIRGGHAMSGDCDGATRKPLFDPWRIVGSNPFVSSARNFTATEDFP
jgi:hypothetical protein